jgi:hypothetical protein
LIGTASTDADLQPFLPPGYHNPLRVAQHHWQESLVAELVYLTDVNRKPIVVNLDQVLIISQDGEGPSTITFANGGTIEVPYAPGGIAKAKRLTADP